MRQCAGLTQRRTRLLRWRRGGGPRCYLGSSCAQSLAPDNKSSRVEVSVCSRAWGKKKRGGGGYTCFSKTWNRVVDFSHRTLADRGRCLQDWSRCGPQQLLQITGPLQVIAVQCEQHSKLRFVFWRPLEWRFLPPFLNNSRDPKQPEVCDHDFIGVVENVLRLQVFVDNAFSVQVAHSLCRKKQTEMVREVLLLYQTGMLRFKLLLFTKGKKNYLHNLLSDLSRLINIQSVFSVSNNWIQRPPFTETAGREKKKI